MSVAFFRPADGRAEAAGETVRELGAEPLADPLLAVEPTGAMPRSDAEWVVLTSKTGAELLAEGGWSADASVAAIGEPTAAALEAGGYTVDLVPEEFSSAGLVEALAPDVPGRRIEVARSDHGSAVLLEGLNDAGGFVHETVLYRLVRPEGSGDSATAAAEGDLSGACFTSSLTVEHFVEAAAERGVRGAAIAGLDAAVVGAIGEPTRRTAESHGIGVDVVPEAATFDALAAAVVERL